MLVCRNFAARLDHNFVAGPAVIFFIVAVEVLAFGQPETNFVIPMVRLHPDCHGLVHSALADHGAVLFFSVGRDLDEPGTKWVREVPDV